MRKIGLGLAVAPILTDCTEEQATTRLLDAMGEASADGPAAVYFEYGEPTCW